MFFCWRPPPRIGNLRIEVGIEVGIGVGIGAGIRNRDRDRGTLLRLVSGEELESCKDGIKRGGLEGVGVLWITVGTDTS